MVRGLCYLVRVLQGECAAESDRVSAGGMDEAENKRGCRCIASRLHKSEVLCALNRRDWTHMRSGAATALCLSFVIRESEKLYRAPRTRPGSHLVQLNGIFRRSLAFETVSFIVHAPSTPEIGGRPVDITHHAVCSTT